MPERTHIFQPPKGTRDFYPAEMAARRHLESIWRQVSINHGFEEIDGPTFEHLDLYTVKSGEEIVSQLFRFQREGGDTEYALRPEFTPTLARMYAARAGSLPNPTKWFSIPNFFRAERPQRGRLREFFQWNVDIIGTGPEESWRAILEVEAINVLVSCFQALKLKATDVRIKLGDRQALRGRLAREGRTDEQIDHGDLTLLDKRSTRDPEEFRRAAKARGWSDDLIQVFDPINREIVRLDADPDTLPLSKIERDSLKQKFHQPGDLFYEVRRFGISEWCEFDSMIVRGLAYYTGLVFEAHEASGAERAIAGGGRYIELVQLFGGPPTPAVGFAMGDVVIRLVLEDLNKLDPPETYLPRPDVFIISSGDDLAEKQFAPLVARLRREGLHVRHSYRATKNVGKLLGEASKARARVAVILGKELEGGSVVVKDLESGEQRPHSFDDLSKVIRAMLETQRAARPGG